MPVNESRVEAAFQQAVKEFIFQRQETQEDVEYGLELTGRADEFATRKLQAEDFFTVISRMLGEGCKTLLLEYESAMNGMGEIKAEAEYRRVADAFRMIRGLIDNDNRRGK